MEEQIKGFQKSFNIFITTLIFFVFIIFLPYITFIGNAVEFRGNIDLTDQEKSCNFDIQKSSIDRALKHSSIKIDNKIITQDQLNKLIDQPVTLEKFEQLQDQSVTLDKIKSIKNEIEAIEKRVESLKLPFIDSIPATTSEIILISPLIISIYFLFSAFRFNQIDLTANTNENFKIQTKLISILIFSAWIYILSMLTVNWIYPNSCQLFNIIRSELIYQQRPGLYNFFYFISSIFSVLSLVIFWAGKSIFK